MKNISTRPATFPLLLLLFSLLVFLESAQSILAQTTSWISPTSVDTVKNPVPFSSPAMADAKKIYNNTCWSCHGVDGKGNGPASVKMNPKPADHTSSTVLRQSDGALFWKISVGKGDMQPYSKLLTVKQRWALVNYIRSLSAAGESEKTKSSQIDH